MEIFATIWKFIKNARYLKGITNKTEARIVSIENPHDDYYVIKLEPSEGFSWNPGEHIMLKLIGHKTGKKESRMLSIASIEDEGQLIFGTRIGKEASSFKKALISLKPGDAVSLQGAFGWFRIRDDKSPIILFAGGIGITPVRAILKDLAHSQTRPINIVYSSSDSYLFIDEIQRLVDNNSSMTLYKVTSREEGHNILSQLAEKYGNDGYYYMSSSPRVISSVVKTLKSKGISSSRMIDDTMRGY